MTDQPDKFSTRVPERPQSRYYYYCCSNLARWRTTTRWTSSPDCYYWGRDCCRGFPTVNASWRWTSRLEFCEKEEEKKLEDCKREITVFQGVNIFKLRTSCPSILYAVSLQMMLMLFRPFPHIPWCTILGEGYFCQKATRAILISVFECLYDNNVSVQFNSPRISVCNLAGKEEDGGWRVCNPLE